MRSILRCKRDTPINSMLKELNFLSVKQRVTVNTMVLLFKMEVNILPAYLCRNLRLVGSLHTHNTRSANDLALPHVLKHASQNSIFYKGMKIYNRIRKLPEFKNCQNLDKFKKTCENCGKTHF